VVANWLLRMEVQFYYISRSITHKESKPSVEGEFMVTIDRVLPRENVTKISIELNVELEF